MILEFSLKVGKSAIPLWYKIFEYDEDDSRSFSHVKEGIQEIKEIFKPHNYEIILLGDRGFKSIELFEYVDSLELKYCIRCPNDMLVQIQGQRKINYLKDIFPMKKGVKKFNRVLLSGKEHKCNLAVCKAEESEDTFETHYFLKRLLKKLKANAL
ncbi:hypothetical protein [Clostridium algidicarnis]|uniref:hypothetical protein n=1 Tax=Clostridium algidicarnis TaxID=37659 RepID=UPI003FD80780